MALTKTLKDFAVMAHRILRSDRDIIVAGSGMTGTGKSCFFTQFLKEYAAISKTYWGFDRMTWSRKELKEWIDGEHKLPLYSSILCDELILMFYKRMWSNTNQISSISQLNMSRDRRLLIAGNIPQFWDLDSGIQSRIRFYVYIPIRGKAWVFEQENNPFNADTWNARENMKLFRKYNNPYACKNFLFTVPFPDWEPSEKSEYYRIRNQKRKIGLKEQEAEQDRRMEYKDIRAARKKLIIMLLEAGVKPMKIWEPAGVSYDYVIKVRNGKL